MRRCYSRHGIRVRDGDTVIDAGANVGLFTLFLLRGGAIGYVTAHQCWLLLPCRCCDTRE